MFIQIGKFDLKNFFTEIEDLKGAKFDIVSTYSLEQTQRERIAKHLKKVFAQ